MFLNYLVLLPKSKRQTNEPMGNSLFVWRSNDAAE